MVALAVVMLNMGAAFQANRFWLIHKTVGGIQMDVSWYLGRQVWYLQLALDIAPPLCSLLTEHLHLCFRYIDLGQCGPNFMHSNVDRENILLMCPGISLKT